MASRISVFGLCYSGNAALLVTFFTFTLGTPYSDSDDRWSAGPESVRPQIKPMLVG